MRQTFIELYNYKSAWLELPEGGRAALAAGVTQAVAQLEENGVEVIGYGFNDPVTDRRAPYDFFCVYSVPNAEFQRVFEQEVAKSGWYDFFDQVNVSGPTYSARGGLLYNAALKKPSVQGKAIPDRMSFQKSRVRVLGREMAYVDVGQGPPVVFVHGNPMSSFLWRNIIPYLSTDNRCIAVDLIGMGDSDKLPDHGPETYSVSTHQKFFDAFVDALDLGDSIALVGQDWGADLAMDWARRSTDRAACIAFSEAIVPPFDWEHWPAEARDLLRLVRSTGGAEAVIENNLIVEGVQNAVLRRLSAAERAEYRRPFLNPGEDRRPTHAWTGSIPLDGSPAEVGAYVDQLVRFMARSDIPKLLIDAEPGWLMTGERRERVRAWPNLTEVAVTGLHWPQEDSPHEFGEALAGWVSAVRAKS
jgi:haloalkane dehalogenase